MSPVFYIISFVLGVVMAWIASSKIIPQIFPYLVLEFEKRENGLFPLIDRMRVTEDKRKQLRMNFLKQRGRRIGAIDFKDIYMNKDTGGGTILLFSPDRENTVPLKFNEEAGEIKTIDRDQRFLNILEAEEEAIQFSDKTWIEKYGFLMSAGIIMIIMVVIVVYGLDSLAVATSQGQAIVEKQGMFNEQIMKWIQQGGGTAPQPMSNVPPPAP